MIGQLHWDGVVLPIPELTWDNVLATANRLEGLDVGDEFFVIYKDEEGEVINVSNAIDLVEATRWAVAHGVPCLCLQVPFASADSESDESWTEIDGSRRDLPTVNGDDVDESERRSVLHDEVEEEEIFFHSSSKESPLRHQEVATTQEDLEVQHSDGTPETLPEEPEPATPVEEAVEIPQPVEQEVAIEQQEEAIAPVEEEHTEIVPVNEAFTQSPPAEEVEYETSEEEKPSVVVVEPAKSPVESPAAGLHERIIDIMVSVNEDSVQELSQSDSSFLLDFLSDERAVDRLVAFISQPSVRSVISVVARAERASPGIAQKSATTQLIKVLYQCPEALSLLSAVPSFEEGLVRVLKALRASPPAKPQEESREEEQEEPTPSPLVVHPNVACNGCETDAEIVGVRYKSIVRADFDLCAACEASGRFQAEAGPFVKIVDPSTAPDFILCAMAGTSGSLEGLRGIENLEGADPIANEFVDFVRSRRTASAVAAAAPAQVEAVATTKRCDHQLKTFEAKTVEYVCDLCNGHQPQGAVLHGCRVCDFDVCQRCAAENSATISIAPQAPQARFISDVTLADGSAVRPGERLVKTWRVRNSGPEAWPVGTRISHVGGDALGGPATGVEVPLAAPGETVNISVELTMPHIPGRYTSYWRMMTPHPINSKFGHRFWVTVNVLPQNVSIAPVQMPITMPWGSSTLASAPSFLAPSAPLFDLEPISVSSTMLPGSPAVATVQITQRPPPPPPPPVMFSNYDDTVARVLDFGFTDIEQVVRVVNEVNGDASAAIERLLEDSA